MKKFLSMFLLSFLAVFSVAGQVSNLGFNYQGVYRDNTGAIQKNKTVSTNFIIYQGPVASGNIVYSENQSATTDNFGVFNMVIGNGTPSGSFKFSNVDWSGANGQYYLKVQIVISGTPTDISTTQFMSVPYAKTSANTMIINSQNAKNGDLLQYDASSGQFKVTPNPWMNYAIFEERLAAGKNAGANNTGWVVRSLNTVVDTVGSNINLNTTSNQFTLAPGKYYVEGYTRTTMHYNRMTGMIFNVTDNTPALYGSSGQTSDASSNGTDYSSDAYTYIQGTITVTGTSSKTFNLQMYSSAAAPYIGLGASDYATAYSGASTYKPEIYSRVFIQKIK